MLKAINGLLFLVFTTFHSIANADTFVYVHGAWSGGWSFKEVAALLETKGHKVYRPTLTGLGERSHLTSPNIGLDNHISDIKNVIIFENLHDVVLVGHSYGGMVITGVAEQLSEHIKRMIYIDAFLPENEDSVMGLLKNRGFDRFLPPVKDGFVPPFTAKETDPLPHDIPHPFKTFTDKISLKDSAYKKIPGQYILTVEKGKNPEDDCFFEYKERASKRGWKIHELISDHNPQLSEPTKLSKILLESNALKDL